MIGLRYTPIAKIGKYLISAMLVISIIFSGCMIQPVNNRKEYSGDWTYELTGGYSLDAISSRRILLVRPSGSNVLNQFFVTDFCMNQEYIGISGVGTSWLFVTEEELANENRKYYLVEVASDTLYGSFKTLESFYAQCEAVSAGDLGEWYATKDLP